MLWKLIFCLSLLIVVTSKEVEQKNKFEDVANEILLKFSKTHGHKLKEFAKVLKETPKAQEAIINEYIDDLLKELNVFIAMQGFDPIEMPDIKENFEWKVGFIKYKGLMHLTNGSLYGLATMNRHGDVKVTYKFPNVQFRLPMGYDVLTFNYKYNAQFMGLGPSGKVDGKSVNCKFVIDMELDLVTLIAKLNKFNLNTVGNISLKFSGSILTDWMLNVFVSVTIPFIKPILNIIIQSFVVGGVHAVFDFYNNFMCTFLESCLL